MDEYSVRILSTAQIDFLDIVEHLNALSPEAAVQYYELFIDRLNVLATAPDQNPLARDAQLRLRGYRTMSINDYTVFYVVRERTVEIRRVLYTKRQYERLFQG